MAQKSIETTIEIDAPASKVWEVFSDFEHWPDWNPFVRSIEGQVEVGEKISVRIEPPGGRGMTFKPEVLVVEPEKELRWLGHLLISGIFNGEHIFEFKSTSDQQAQFTQREQFDGILVGMLLNVDQTRNGFEAMNKALKERVESKETNPQE